MRSWYLHITKVLMLVAFTGSIARAQVLEENFNTGSINQREDDCWQYENFEINNTNPINSGGDKKQGSTVNMDSYSFWNFASWASSSSMTSPFMQFDGSGFVAFKHKSDNDNYAYLAGGSLTLYLVDVNGNAVSTVFTHVYKQLGWSTASQYPNGSPDVTQVESIPVTWNGFYRLRWEWNDFGDAETEYYIDDIMVDYDDTPLEESTVVCFDESVFHIPTGAIDAGGPNYFTYTWSWDGKSGGNIKSQSSNDKTVSVEWNAGAGTYRLKIVETYGGSCEGRTFYINVDVMEQPVFSITTSTVCQGERPVMNFDASIGKAPFTVTYNDGSGPQVFITAGRETVLLDADAPAVEILEVVDDNGCYANPGLIKSYPILYHPKPNTDPIYHY